jgi:chromosome segregation ATPase
LNEAARLKGMIKELEWERETMREAYEALKKENQGLWEEVSRLKRALARARRSKV